MRPMGQGGAGEITCRVRPEDRLDSYESGCCEAQCDQSEEEVDTDATNPTPALAMVRPFIPPTLGHLIRQARDKVGYGQRTYPRDCRDEPHLKSDGLAK
jgi:hypothetical protein